jgi:hypothetical protein
MSVSAARYDRWKAPAADGETLVWPAADQLLQDTRDNHQRLGNAHSVRIQNLPLPELRSRMRQWLGHRQDDQPLIATGHQAELYHPGVWAKDVLIDAVASRLDGQAYHVAVDTDEPKHLQLRFPGGSIQLLDDADTDARWSGLLPAPTPAHLAIIENDINTAAASWNFQPMIGRFLTNMRRCTFESPNLATALTNSLHELDWSLGLRHHAMLASPIWMSEPYLVFAHHLLARSGQFAGDYNSALADYRAENKIRSAGRPMPDLTCNSHGCETPFWLDALDQNTRMRASVERQADGTFAMTAPRGERFEFDALADGWEAAGRLRAWLVRNQLRLSPRALTLTAVLRLLVADQFAHGIGGGQYDQVLDGLIQRHFKLDPPRFCVTTATLFFPSAIERNRVCLPCVQQEGRRLKHSVLGEQKTRMVERIERLPRGSTERSELFFAMHDQLAAAWRGDAVRDWERRYEQAERRSAQERTLFDRELFYALQPASRLSAIIERQREQLA